MTVMTLALLRAEIDNDPKSLGLATLKVQTNGAQAVAAKLNEVGASAETLFKDTVPTEEALACIVLTEFNARTAVEKTAIDMFFRGAKIKSGNANLRTTMAALFPAGTTRTALIAIASRSCSRAEALWGEFHTVTDTDVAMALELP